MWRLSSATLASLLATAPAISLMKRDLSLSTGLKERPVMKVVRLLQDMQAELEHELDDDQAVHEKLSCWCKQNDQEKTQAIELGEQKEAELEAFLGEAAAKMKELKAKRDATLDEVDRDFDALNKAQALRMKENQAFHAEEADLLEAIKACDQALVVLKEYNPSPAGLAQVRAVAQRLQQSQVLDLVKRTLVGPAASYQLAALQNFLAQAQDGASFLTIPGFQSYGSQSGQIFGILAQMKEDFEHDLSSSQRKEKQSAEEFAELKAAKEEEITAGRQLMAKLESEIADLKVKHAEAFKELEDTQAQLELDRTFLANLKKKCSESAEEFDARVQDRREEIVAVSDTIKILNSDDAFENFDKTVNTASFLQLGSVNADRGTEAQQQRLSRAGALLQQYGMQLEAPQLLLLASKTKLDTFTKVKEMIDKLVTELTQQQKDEVAHRDWCHEELASNERSTAAQNDKKEGLQTKISDTEHNIAQHTKEIEEITAAVAEMQEQMKRASEVREAEAADYQETIQDQRLTQTILQKAIERMRAVYALIQGADGDQPGAPHIQTSGTHTDPGNGPARFTKYEKNAGGGRVVNLLESVLEDSKKLENDAIAQEQNAQGAYEMFMQDSNKAITAYNEKSMSLRGAVARAKEDLILANTDLKATVHELENLAGTLGDLKESCDFLLKNFEARQEARGQEIEALRQAKAILSGMQ